jgi:integrase
MILDRVHPKDMPSVNMAIAAGLIFKDFGVGTDFLPVQKNELCAKEERSKPEISRGALDVQTFISQKQRQRYAPKTIVHLRNLLGKIFSVAVSWGWMNGNPTTGVELPPREKRREARVLPLGEIARLSQAFGEPVRTIFLLGLLTGLRIGEILGIRVGDVDLTGRLLYVRRDVYRGHVQDVPKTKHSERGIPLAAILVAAIQQWLEIRPGGSDWLFPSKAGTPHHDRNLLRREVWPVGDRLDVPRFGWHSLRHTFSTYGGNSGMATPVLQSILGHASAETTMIYTHPLVEAQREAVEKLARVLFPNVPTLASEQSGRKTIIQ